MTRHLRKMAVALFAFAAPLPSLTFAQREPVEVGIRFELFAPEVATDKIVFITGSVPGLGSWNPGKIAMKSEGEHRWSHSIKISKGTAIEYKYTLGSWANEGAAADGSPLKNLTVDAQADKTVSDRINVWTVAGPRKIQGGITGSVEYHLQLKFAGLLPRDVVVWLPPGYRATDQRFGVLYMHDGQNTVDPATSSFGIDWQIDETMTRLIAAGECRPIIVVGIYSTAERSEDYLPGEQGDRYTEFVCSKLKPLIDGRYRTRPERIATAIGGSSNGGICAFRIAWENPDLFSAAICFSPAFQVLDAEARPKVDYVSHFRKSATPSQVPYFYLANGGVGLEKMLQPGIDTMLKAMTEKGLVDGRNFEWKLESTARHEESAWAKQFQNAALKLFAPE